MNVATVVLTAPRPRSTLEKTLESLAAAGWGEGPLMVHEDRAACQFRAYMTALAKVAEHWPAADAYLVVEDDVVFCRGLRRYLDATLWPGPVERIALCSPYCPRAYRHFQPGWDDTQSCRGLYLSGSQAWIFPPSAVRAILAEVAPLESTYYADREIGRWAEATGRKVWYHTPSLAQHAGVDNSALGNDGESDIRVAVDFVGEDVDVLDVVRAREGLGIGD